MLDSCSPAQTSHKNAEAGLQFTFALYVRIVSARSCSKPRLEAKSDSEHMLLWIAIVVAVLGDYRW